LYFSAKYDESYSKKSSVLVRAVRFFLGIFTVYPSLLLAKSAFMIKSIGKKPDGFFAQANLPHCVPFHIPDGEFQDCG
jgi:hypothetical protein